MPGSLNAKLEEKLQELVTAVQYAFQLGISGLCEVDQPSPPKQNLHCDLVSAFVVNSVEADIPAAVGEINVY